MYFPPIQLNVLGPSKESLGWFWGLILFISWWQMLRKALLSCFLHVKVLWYWLHQSRREGFAGVTTSASFLWRLSYYLGRIFLCKFLQFSTSVMKGAWHRSESTGLGKTWDLPLNFWMILGKPLIPIIIFVCNMVVLAVYPLVRCAVRLTGYQEPFLSHSMFSITLLQTLQCSRLFLMTASGSHCNWGVAFMGLVICICRRTPPF